MQALAAVLAMIELPRDIPWSEIPARATGVLVVDLRQIRANWRALAAHAAPAECAAVVKADAYGLGAAHVIPALAAEGCRTFFVATADEAEQARALAPGAVIYVLDGNQDSAFLNVIDARPVLSDLGELADWARHSREAGRRLAAALQIESGLNRRGISSVDLGMTRAAMHDVDLTLVMSHLACADVPDDPMNARQRAVFEAARALLPPVPASLAASDGLMLGKDYHYDLVRPGYALYGGQAFGGGRAPVAPVVCAYARVLQVRSVAPGETVGYAATWTSTGHRRVATIAAGYADGVFRHASGSHGHAGGIVAIRGKQCSIVGRVSMDLVTADVSDAIDTVDRLDPMLDWAELIGPSLTLEQVGVHAGTIGYEVLTRLGRRFHRIYLGAEPLAAATK